MQQIEKRELEIMKRIIVDKLHFDLCFSQWYDGELSFESAREILLLKPTTLFRMFTKEIERLGLSPRGRKNI